MTYPRIAGRDGPGRLGVELGMLLLAGALFLGVACSDSEGNDAASLSDPAITGSHLVNEYVTLLRDKDVDGLRGFLSDAFIIQRADGSHSEKAAYVENIPEIREFTISDVSALQAGNSLIVRWLLTVDEEIDGRQYSGEPAPRLSTFVYQDGDWRLSSHANFNAPEAPSPPASPSSN